MTDRRRLQPEPAGGGSYFVPDEDVDFFSTGSKLLDLGIGGGWAERRVSNIIGENAAGKTLLAIEAGVNFIRKYKKGKVRYREGESAFSKSYVTKTLGMPLTNFDFGDEKNTANTIEDLYEELAYRVENAKHPELMIVDSLDSFSTRAELARAIDQDSYGAEKAKQMSALFRRINAAMAAKNITLMVISQIRDKIGAKLYGRKWTRSGGRALDFYASQRLILKQKEKLTKTIRGIERAIGVSVEVYVDKNKVGAAYNSVKFPIMFGYGIDDEQACRDFLKKLKVPVNGSISLPEIHTLVEQNWVALQNAFAPKTKKYGDA